MTTYLVLIRGINVGGKNRVSMARLRDYLEDLGYTDVSTYIASGNVILRSKKGAPAVKSQIEQTLPKAFKLDSDLVKVLVLTHKQLAAIVRKKPRGFGGQPKKYYCDAVFLMDIAASEAMAVFDPREGVDRVWAGDGVIYSQRLAAKRTQSRLSKIVGTSAYQSMTIRSWGTTTTLLAKLDELT